MNTWEKLREMFGAGPDLNQLGVNQYGANHGIEKNAPLGDLLYLRDSGMHEMRQPSLATSPLLQRRAKRNVKEIDEELMLRELLKEKLARGEGISYTVRGGPGMALPERSFSTQESAAETIRLMLDDKQWRRK